jgi:predicted RNase H-like HicB family nuclease
VNAVHIVDRYHYSAGWGEDARCYTAACAEFQGITVQSDTAERALALLKNTVQDIVAGMLESGEELPEPFDEPFEGCP